MGPYRLMDEIGIDVMSHAGSTMAEAFGERMAPAAALVALAGSGRLGRKGGRGFYLYEKGREKAFDTSVYSDMKLSSVRAKAKPDQIRDRLVLVMINEAARVLEEGVVASAADVDLGMVMGTGFAPFRGGLLKYADDRGAAEVAGAMEALRRTCGSRYEPVSLVAELARTGGSFHGPFRLDAGVTRGSRRAGSGGAPGGRMESGAPAGRPPRTGPVAGVVLAAGGSTRMGTPKALLDAEGTTFVARLAGTLRRGGCDPVVVVAADDAGPVGAEAERCGARLVVNPGGEGGQIGSLRAALADLRALDGPPAAVIFTPVDNPAVSAATVRTLIEAWERSEAAIVAPNYQGKRGHPVLADMSIAAEFLDDGLAEGARTVVRRDPARVLEVPVPDPATLDDIDTARAYRDRFPEVNLSAAQVAARVLEALEQGERIYTAVVTDAPDASLIGRRWLVLRHPQPRHPRQPSPRRGGGRSGAVPLPPQGVPRRAQPGLRVPGRRPSANRPRLPRAARTTAANGDRRGRAHRHSPRPHGGNPGHADRGPRRPPRFRRTRALPGRPRGSRHRLPRPLRGHPARPVGPRHPRYPRHTASTTSASCACCGCPIPRPTSA